MRTCCRPVDAIGEWPRVGEMPKSESVQRFNFGGQGRDRTADPRFFRPVLYQLSYLTKALGPAGPSVDSGGSDGI